MEAFLWTELLCSARWHLWETSNDVLSGLLTSCGKFRSQQHYYTFQHCNFWSVWSQCIVLLHECWALHEMTWLLTALAEKNTHYCVRGRGKWTSRPNDAWTIWCAFKLLFWGKHNVLPNRSIIFSMLLVGVSHCKLFLDGYWCNVPWRKKKGCDLLSLSDCAPLGCLCWSNGSSGLRLFTDGLIPWFNAIDEMKDKGRHRRWFSWSHGNHVMKDSFAQQFTMHYTW